VNRSNLANVAAAADGDRNYMHINLSKLMILIMIMSGMYPHAYRDYSDNRGSRSVCNIDLLLPNYVVSSQKTAIFMVTYLAYILSHNWLACHLSVKCSIGFSLLLIYLIFIF
jgi:hypothetical protein